MFAIMLTLWLAGLFEVAAWAYRRGSLPAVGLIAIAANLLMVMFGFTFHQLAPASVLPGI